MTPHTSHSDHKNTSIINSSAPACAACKHQRRKCARNCPLAPYFPPNRQKDFLNVHKVFGVSNVLKTLNTLTDPKSKELAVKSLVFHANARVSDPVGGCVRIISDLQHLIDQTAADLCLVAGQLSVCRRSVSAVCFPPVDCDSAPESDYYPGGAADSVKSEILEDVSEDIKPFLQMFDERQSNSISALDTNPVILTKCSEKFELQEAVELVQQKEDHDLKDVTSPFSLKKMKRTSEI